MLSLQTKIAKFTEISSYCCPFESTNYTRRALLQIVSTTVFQINKKTSCLWMCSRFVQTNSSTDYIPEPPCIFSIRASVRFSHSRALYDCCVSGLPGDEIEIRPSVFPSNGMRF